MGMIHHENRAEANKAARGASVSWLICCDGIRIAGFKAAQKRLPEDGV